MPALRKADQVAAPGMQGGTGARFLLVTHRLEAGEADFCHFGSRAVPCQAGTHTASPSNARYSEPGAFAGRQAPALQSHAKDTCSPLPEPCQVPQKGRTDAGRGREPAARVQPCTAITVLLIPRGFRMSEPGVPRQGQLSQGRAAIPAHEVDAPRYSLLWLVPGRGEKNTFALPGCRQGERTAPTDSPPALPAASHAAGHKTTAVRSGRACPCLAQGKGLPAAAPRHGDNVTSPAEQAGEIYRSLSPGGMATQPPSAATEITHLIGRRQTCSSRECH